MTDGSDAPIAVAPGTDADRLIDRPVGVRLRELARAVNAMADGTPLPRLLDEVVTAAAAMVGAGHGTLTVRGIDGAQEEYAYTGVDDADATGRIPAGLALLGAIAAEPGALRLHRLADHPAAVGVPAGHPAMGPFLGVAVRTRAEVCGALHLTGKTGGADFTAEDAVLVEVLAAAVGVAVDNARLTAERSHRARWAAAFAEIRAALLSGPDSGEALPLIAARARELTGADAALLLLPDPGAPGEQLMVMVADGRDAAELRGLRTPVAGSLAGRVYRSGDALSIADVAAAETHEPAFDDHEGYGPAVLAPLGGPMEMGVLIVAKLTGTSALSPGATAVAVDFAGQAALALRMDEAQRTQREIALLADRERIGRDLHDQVIQRLFATGMGLESITRQVTAPALQGRLRRAVDDLDQTVRDIRRAIFELQEPIAGPLTLRQQIISVLESAMGSSTLDIKVLVADSVDAVVPPEVADQALAVLREAVTNVIRHAAASRLSVSVTAADRLRIEVTDDGRGFPVGGRRGGLANLAERARRLGGELDLEASPSGPGATLVWDVPLPQGIPSA